MLSRRTPLTRTGPLARHTPLAPRSPTQAAATRPQQATYAALDAGSDGWCLACGRAGPLDHSHCLTQKQHPKHRSNPLNIVHLCRSCHCLWENNKASFKMHYPLAFAEKVRRMEVIDRQAAAFFKMKNENLFK